MFPWTETFEQHFLHVDILLKSICNIYDRWISKQNDSHALIFHCISNTIYKTSSSNIIYKTSSENQIQSMMSQWQTPGLNLLENLNSWIILCFYKMPQSRQIINCISAIIHHLSPNFPLSVNHTFKYWT